MSNAGHTVFVDTLHYIPGGCGHQAAHALLHRFIVLPDAHVDRSDDQVLQHPDIVPGHGFASIAVFCRCLGR
jgi:hypothetical protein